jgi:hypothetical protein
MLTEYCMRGLPNGHCPPVKPLWTVALRVRQPLNLRIKHSSSVLLAPLEATVKYPILPFFSSPTLRAQVRVNVDLSHFQQLAFSPA